MNSALPAAMPPSERSSGGMIQSESLQCLELVLRENLARGGLGSGGSGGLMTGMLLGGPRYGPGGNRRSDMIEYVTACSRHLQR